MNHSETVESLFETLTQLGQMKELTIEQQDCLSELSIALFNCNTDDALRPYKLILKSKRKKGRTYTSSRRDARLFRPPFLTCASYVRVSLSLYSFIYSGLQTEKRATPFFPNVKTLFVIKQLVALWKKTKQTTCEKLPSTMTSSPSFSLIEDTMESPISRTLLTPIGNTVVVFVVSLAFFI